MKKQFLLFVLLLAGCQKPAVEKAAAQKVEPASATDWTERAELFVEYPPLAPGKTSRFAVHLTDLANFHAVAHGAVEVELQQGKGAPEVFRTEAPAKPGIYGVDVTPKTGGPYRMAIRWMDGGKIDRHELGEPEMAGHPSREEPKQEETIAFLKEQQWALEFGTAVVEERSLRESLRVPGEVMARSGGEATVVAPFDGRLATDALPVLGANVKMGQILTRIVPPTATPADLTGLEAALAETEVQLEQARKDRARAERLVASGAAPGRRMEEAKTWEATLETRRQAAKARLAQYETSSAGEGTSPGAKWFALRAPLAGVVSVVPGAAGAVVKAGAPVVQIVDLDRVYVSAIVPESEYPKMRELTAAELEIPGVEKRVALNKRIQIGAVVDAPSRTFPVVYEVENRERRVAINQTIQIRLLFAPAKAGVVAPESALVDDAGRAVVFVQKEGEAFARRPVTVGRRSEGLVEIVSGVAKGERVVVRGAHLIRLAALSTQVPAHGHVH